MHSKWKYKDLECKLIWSKNESKIEERDQNVQLERLMTVAINRKGQKIFNNYKGLNTDIMGARILEKVGFLLLLKFWIVYCLYSIYRYILDSIVLVILLLKIHNYREKNKNKKFKIKEKKQKSMLFNFWAWRIRFLVQHPILLFVFISKPADDLYSF